MKERANEKESIQSEFKQSFSIKLMSWFKFILDLTFLKEEASYTEETEADESLPLKTDHYVRFIFYNFNNPSNWLEFK